MRSSRRPTGTGACRRCRTRRRLMSAETPTIDRRSSTFSDFFLLAPRPRLRGRHRPGDAHPAFHRQQDLQRIEHRLRRRAEHAGLGGRPGAAGHAAGAQPRRGRARHPLRAGGRRAGGRAVDLRAQELLLSRPAQGLPDQPVRDAGGAGRHGRVHGRRAAACGAPDARAPGRGRRQVAARGLRRPDRHRPQPRRHAAAGDRHRARHALQRRGGRVRQGAACAGGLARHLRRQHAGRLVPLRRERLGEEARRAPTARGARSRT